MPSPSPCTRYAVRGTRYAVRGTRYAVRGTRYAVRGTRYAVRGTRYAVRGRIAKAYSVYALIDEAYAVTAASRVSWTTPRLLAMQIAFQCYWVGGGLTGLLVSSLIPGVIEGLESSLCALFVTLTLDAVKTRTAVPSLLLGGLSLSVALVLTPDRALFLGLFGFVGLLLVRHLITRPARLEQTDV